MKNLMKKWGSASILAMALILPGGISSNVECVSAESSIASQPYWVGDILKTEESSIKARSETGEGYTLLENDRFTVVEWLEENCYKIKIPTKNEAFFVELDSDDASIHKRPANEVENFESIKFVGDYSLTTYNDCSFEHESGSVESGATFKMFEIADKAAGWIQIGERNFINLGDYSDFEFTYKKVTSNESVIRFPQNFDNSSIHPEKYQKDDILVALEDVEISDYYNETVFILSPMIGIKVVEADAPWYWVEVNGYTGKEALFLCIDETSYSKFSLVYREELEISEKPVTTVKPENPVTTVKPENPVTTVKPEIPSETDKKEDNDGVETCYKEGTTLMFTGISWGIRSTPIITNENRVGQIDSSNSLVQLGKYLGNGWYEIQDTKFYIRILESEKKYFSNVLFKVGDTLILRANHWRLRSSNKFVDENIVKEIYTGDQFIIRKVLPNQWYTVDYKGENYFLNIPLTEVKWFRKK